MNYGYVKVAAAVPRVKVADCKFNASEIEKEIIIADGKGVQIIAFPELCITGYTCGDLFAQQLLLEEAEMGLIQILNNTRQMDIISILGMPVALNGVLLNAAVVIQKGRVLGVVPKTYLPNYKEFYEKRWFTSACDVAENSVRLCGQIIPMGRDLLFETADTTFGVEICEDLWAPIPPSSTLALQGAEILFNLSADNEGIGKHNYLRSLISQQSARCIAGYVFSSCGFGESTTDVVFAGNGLIYENGTLLAANERFSFEGQVVISEIDVEHLRTERRVNTTFAACHANCVSALPVRISTEYVNSRDLNLTRTFEPHPFGAARTHRYPQKAVRDGASAACAQPDAVRQNCRERSTPQREKHGSSAQHALFRIQRAADLLLSQGSQSTGHPCVGRHQSLACAAPCAAAG